MKRGFRHWVKLTSAEESGLTMALMRIFVSMVVIYSLGSVYAADLVDVLWVGKDHGGVLPLKSDGWLVNALGGPTHDVVWALFLISALGAVALLMGLASRFAALVTGQAYFALVTINPDASGGYDLLITNALWLLVLSQSDATLSFACRRATGRWWSEARISAMPRRLAIVQLLVVYTSTGWHKLSATWTPGGDFSALYWAFQDPTWRRFDMGFTAHWFPLTQVATATTWLFEAVFAPLMLLAFYLRTAQRVKDPGLVRRMLVRFDLRPPFVAIGVCLHLGILLALNVGPFSWITLSYYVCLFRPEEITGGFANLKQHLGRTRSRGSKVVADAGEAKG